MNARTLLRGFSIRTRMLGAIVMVLAMFAAVGITGLWGGQRLASLNGEIMSQSTGEQRTVAELRRSLSTINQLEKQMTIDYEGGVSIGAQRGSWSVAVADARKNFAKMLEGEEDEDNPIARHALEQLASYAKAAEPVLLQAQDGAFDSSRAIHKALAAAHAGID